MFIRPYNICICAWFGCGKELCLLLVVKRDAVEPGECVCKGLELRRERDVLIVGSRRIYHC
jgi:hypothetical protein